MAVFDNMNKINFNYNTGVSDNTHVAASVVDYHTKNLLKNVRASLVYTRDMQMRPLPAHNGKRVQFRKVTPWLAATTPLVEGVTPDGQTIDISNFFATVRAYGKHVELSDEMDWVTIDDMHRVVNEELSAQAALTIDTLARDAVMDGTNVQCAGGKRDRESITANDKLTYAEVKKAVRTLKKNNAKKFDDGFYHGFIDPDAVYDLTADDMWIDVATYQDKRKVETGELGCMAGVKFFESTNSAAITVSTVEVHQTLIYGKDFAGGVSLEGNGDNVSIIIKPVGSSGALDPLNQRGTMAWKVKAVCYTILQDAFGVRIEHAVTA